MMPAMASFHSPILPPSTTHPSQRNCLVCGIAAPALHQKPKPLTVSLWRPPRFKRAQTFSLVQKISTPLNCGLNSGIRTQLLFNTQIPMLQARGTGSSRCIVIAALDPELHAVFELASDAELSEVSNILYGHSLLSPLLKSVASGDGSGKIHLGDNRLEHECDGRDQLLERLESRFLFLAADAKATLSGRRPAYRDVLLRVRRKLNVPCSVKLSTEDLEAEIFLHLLQEYSSKTKNQEGGLTNNIDNIMNTTKKWQAALKLGGQELLSVAFKGGSAFTMYTLQNLAAKKFSGKILLETARYRVAKEVLQKGGQVVAGRLESHLALLAARQGVVGATSRYLAVRSMMMLVGPVLWGTFFADVLIRSVGTDYARVVRAIYAFAQIRLTRTYGWTSPAQTSLD